MCANPNDCDRTAIVYGFIGRWGEDIAFARFAGGAGETSSKISSFTAGGTAAEEDAEAEPAISQEVLRRGRWDIRTKTHLQSTTRVLSQS
jgi:hypothetical protein